MEELLELEELEELVELFEFVELVEFEDTEEVNRTLLPVNKKPRKRYLLKILKRTLSFIVFGIENVLNKSNKKKPTIQVPNRYENRFKDNRQIK